MDHFSIGNIAKRIDFKRSTDVPNHVPSHVNFWWGRGLWPWPSILFNFFIRSDLKTTWVFRDVKISQNYITWSIYPFFLEGLLVLKTKFYWFEAIGVKAFKGQLILKFLFGVLKFFKKTNGNKSIWSII